MNDEEVDQDADALVCIIKDAIDLQTCLEYTYENPRRHPFFSRVVTVNIETEGSVFLEEHHREDVLSLLRWMRLLPSLCELGLSFSSDPQRALIIHIQDLEDIVRQTPKLTYLAFRGSYTVRNEIVLIFLQGDPSQLTELLKAQGSLQRFDLQNCVSTVHYSNLNPLLESVPSLSSLTTIQFTFDDATNQPNFPAFPQLIARSEFLRVLDLIGWPLSSSKKDDQVAPLIEAIQRNDSLQNLSLGPSVFGPPVYLHTHGILAIRESLQANTTLREMSLAVHHEHTIAPLCEALTTNETLRMLELRWINSPKPKPSHPPLPPKQDTDALLQILEASNYTLTTVRLLAKDTMTTIPGSPQNLAMFWCQLNRMGRGRLLLLRNSQRTKEEWIRALAGCRGSVRMLFYLLSSKPELLAESLH